MKISKTRHLGVLACCLGAGAALAQDGPPPGMPQLPPGVLAQINLGKAGLLGSFYSNEQWGTTQGRIGQSRFTIGTATAPFASTTGYKDGSTDLVLPLSALKALPDGKSYLRFGVMYVKPNGARNQVEVDGNNPSVSVQYMTFPNPNTMLSLGVFAEHTDVRDVVSGAMAPRDGYGIRADLLHKFNDNWGISVRGEYSWGETDLQIPAIGYQHVQGDDRFYTQVELIGSYDSSSFSAVPQGWSLHPTFGINFQRNFLEATADSFGAVSSGLVGDTEDYGMVWASLGLEQMVAPGQWGFNASLGVEHEYVNDLDAFVDESTYIVGSVGASMRTRSGQQVVVGYTRHQGVNGNRWNQTLLASLNFSF